LGGYIAYNLKTDEKVEQGLPKINIPPFPKNNSEVIVAVVDSGIRASDPIYELVWKEESFIREELGYSMTDPSPDDIIGHGTKVAKIISLEAGNASIKLINAKIAAGTNGKITSKGLLEAIKWSIDEGATIINLSLGGSPDKSDVIAQQINELVAEKGAIIICAAGNGGKNYLNRGSINTPGVAKEAITVGAVAGEQIASYSSLGPSYDYMAKPDVVAVGSFEGAQGTSFACPRVSGLAARLVDYTQSQEITVTPGLIKGIIMKGAIPMNSSTKQDEMDQGKGLANWEGAKEALDNAIRVGQKPTLIVTSPQILPFDGDRVFAGDYWRGKLTVVASQEMEVKLEATITTRQGLILPEEWKSDYLVKDTTVITLSLNLTGLEANHWLNVTILINHTQSEVIEEANFATYLYPASARIVLDTQHSLWGIDSQFGQFYHFVKKIETYNLSITETWPGERLTAAFLEPYDGLIIVDPAAIISSFEDGQELSIGFSSEELVAIESFVTGGKRLFVAGLDNQSLNFEKANDLYSLFGCSLEGGLIHGSTDDQPKLVTNTTGHVIFDGVSVMGFDYWGASLNYSVDCEPIAFVNGMIVMVVRTYGDGGVILTGTNFFFDNEGMNGGYNSTRDDELALNIVLWLAKII
jgi:hypothetical protein